MNIAKTTENGVCTVSPSGRIDSASAQEFSTVMEEALKESRNIIVDMKEAEYISSSGLRVLLSAKKALGTAGSIALINVGSDILEVLDLTGFTDILKVEAETEADGSRIRIVFFDVDGTLLSHTTGQVPESTKRALEAVRRKGVRIFIATGRDINELAKLPVLDEITFDGFLTLNGNIILDENRKMYAGNEIDPGEVEILVNIFKAGRIPFVLIGEKERYINYVDDVVIRTQESTHGTIPDIGEYKGEKIYQCLAFVDADMRRRLEDLLDQCLITSWNDTGIDIIAKTGGKAAGIQKVLDIEGLKRSEVMSFGDGENDIPMIRFAGIGVAMGNGGEKVKAAADYVTDSVDNDGIEKALRHFGMID